MPAVRRLCLFAGNGKYAMFPMSGSGKWGRGRCIVVRGVCVLALAASMCLVTGGCPDGTGRVNLTNTPGVDKTYPAIGLPSSQWTTVYSTDFSSDPRWITNNVFHYHWDSSSGTFYLEQVDGANDYTYKVLPGLTSGVACQIEYDIKPISHGWASNSRVSLTTSSNSAAGSSPYLTMDFNRGDQGCTPSILWRDAQGRGGYVHFYGNSLAEGVWYHVLLDWNPASHALYGKVTLRDTGSLLGERTAAVSGDFAGVDRLALSTVDDGYAPGATGKAYIDNITVRQKNN